MVGSASVSVHDAFILEKMKMMHHHVIGQGCSLGYPRGVAGLGLQIFQNFASCPKTALHVSDVFQVSVRMHIVTVRILSV